MSVYTAIRKIGEGTYGEVWLCEDEDGSQVATKTLKPSLDLDVEDRFRREVRILSTLTHTNIVRVLSHKLQTTPLAFTMPIYATTLQAELSNIARDELRIQTIFSSVLDALSYAHSEGVIHRDIKAENVLMNSDSDVVLTDFGLGRDLNSASTRNTMAGYGMGTLYYMAPEQMSDAMHADARSDIYSVGRLLFAMYTGPLTSTVTDTTGLQPRIALVIEKCVNQNPARRYQTIGELQQAWLAVTGQVAALSTHEEVKNLLTSVSSVVVKQSDLDRLLDLLIQGRDDTDLIHQAFMQISGEVAEDMWRRDSTNTRLLIETFVKHCTSQGWGFSYTDKIGSQCRILFDALMDCRVRAELIYCVLEVGTSHNRWHFIEIATNLLENIKDPGEALAIAERLESNPSGLGLWVKRNVATSKLHPTILAAISPLS